MAAIALPGLPPGEGGAGLTGSEADDKWWRLTARQGVIWVWFVSNGYRQLSSLVFDVVWLCDIALV